LGCELYILATIGADAFEEREDEVKQGVYEGVLGSKTTGIF
jgi:hypothetical protein